MNDETLLPQAPLTSSSHSRSVPWEGRAAPTPLTTSGGNTPEDHEKSCEESTSLLKTLPACGKVLPKNVRNLPSYNVRTVVSQWDHPLWSSSLEKRLHYLMDGSIEKCRAFHGCYPNLRITTDDECEHEVTRPTILHCASLETSSMVNYDTYDYGSECSMGSVINPLSMTEGKKSAAFMSISTPRVPGVACGSTASWKAAPKRYTLTLDGEKKNYGPREFYTLNTSLMRDELVVRESIVDEERVDILRIATSHAHLDTEDHGNKVSDGENNANQVEPIENFMLYVRQEVCKEINLREQFGRNHIIQEEMQAFNPIWDLFVYAHRSMTIGSAPLKKFLRYWICWFRSRKERHKKARERFFLREKVSRREITERCAAARQDLLRRLIASAEAIFRLQIESLQLLTQYAHVFTWLHMSSQVEIFPKLFGTRMSRQLCTGRIVDTTVFKELDLREQCYRNQLDAHELKKREGIRCAMALESLVLFEVYHERQHVEERETVERWQQQLRVCIEMQYRHAREIEIQEACEREISIMKAFNAGPTIPVIKRKSSRPPFGEQCMDEPQRWFDSFNYSDLEMESTCEDSGVMEERSKTPEKQGASPKPGNSIAQEQE